MLRPGIAALAAVAVALSLGCADDQSPPATVENVSPLEALLVSFGSQCSIKTVRSLSNSEFPSKDQKKVGDFIKTLDSGTPAQKVAAGFGLLDLLSKDLIAGSLPSTHTAENGSSLTIATTNCIPGAIPPETAELSKAFLTNGLYVAKGLGGAATELPAFSRDGGFAAVQAPASTHGASDFFSWLNGPSVIFGWPIFSDAEFHRTETPVGPGYQLYAIRVGAFSGASGIVGICVGPFPSKNRVQHEQQIEELVDPGLITGWEAKLSCPTPTPPLSLRGRLLKGVFDLLSPPPALALATVGSGTGAKKLSPFGAVDAGSVHLSWTCSDGCAAPANGTVGPLSPTPRVKATGDNGSPLPGVQITISVAGNSGSFKVCGGPNMVGNTSTASTDATGFATFTGLSIDKPGGYTLTAASSYVGFSTTQATTPVLFNLQNSTFSCGP